MPTKAQLQEVVDVLASLVRNIALKRALTAANPRPHLNFWRIVYGNQMDVPVIEWCKLFGSDDDQRNPTHWKNVVADQGKFRSEMLSSIGKTRSEWDAYWHEMNNYRNWAAAHHDARRRTISKYPKLGVASDSACFYYDYVRNELLKVHNVNQQPADIRKYARDFGKLALKVALAALAATKKIPETVR